MSKVLSIFNQIEKLTEKVDECEFLSVLKHVIINGNQQLSDESFLSLKTFLQKIINPICELAARIIIDDTIRISVKNQKLLRKCFQLIISIGISQCLPGPGLWVNPSKRSSNGTKLLLTMSSEQKYETLVYCTDFFIRSYYTPVLKKIIITLHLSDYLASMIQLTYAPLEKPGTYKDFVMTEERYERLSFERLKKYANDYYYLITDCFQPILMKELLGLQSNTESSDFVKEISAKEMSQCVLAPGGLLSLLRCFIECYDIDTGFDWPKIDMICKIVAHNQFLPEVHYLNNICSQLKQILHLNNMHYLAAAVACVLGLHEKYPNGEPVKVLLEDIFKAFDYEHLVTNHNLPGTIIWTPQELEHKTNVLHACVCTTKLDWPVSRLIPNLHLIFLIGVKCTKNDDLKSKLKDIILRSLEKLKGEELLKIIKIFLFGKDNFEASGILVEEHDAGVALKFVASLEIYSKEEALLHFLNIFKASTDEELIVNIFKALLSVLTDLSGRRQMRGNKEILLTEDNPEMMDDVDQQYAAIQQLLSEICISANIVSTLKKNPLIVSDFIHFILKENSESNSECVPNALVLLNTILASSYQSADYHKSFSNLIPIMRKMCESDQSSNSILFQEALSLLNSEIPVKKDTPYERAITDIFDEHLSVRAHGIIELTKLIEKKDAETMSKKLFIFFIFQEQLKDSDSYVYLSAINGLASLCTQFPEDVLHALCNEFLQIANKEDLQTKDRTSELRVEIGDVIVEVTRQLGETATIHKTILLNTMLCGFRDEDPLIRKSALANLSSLAFVLNYKIGSILSKVLLCLWTVVQSDKEVECRWVALLVIEFLLKGLGKETLIEFKDSLVPIYLTVKWLYRDDDEDSDVRLHAELAFEELNNVVDMLVCPELELENKI